jgi:hypothetical protein
MTAFIYDNAGRIVAAVADNPVHPPAPPKFCAHGDLSGCRLCAGARS